MSCRNHVLLLLVVFFPHVVTAQEKEERDPRILHRLTDFHGGVFHVAISPDGKSIATVSALSTAEDEENRTGREARVWDVATGKQLSTSAKLLRQHPYRSAVAFSPDGKRIITAGSAKIREFGVPQEERLDANAVNVRVWDFRSGEVLHTVTLRGHKARATAMAIHPDGKRVVTGSIDRSIRIWGIESGETLMTIGGLRAMPGSPLMVRIDPAGRWIGTGNFNDTRGVVQIWDAKSGEHQKTWQVTGTFLSGISFRDDGRQLVTSGPVRKTPSAFGGDRGRVVRLDVKLWDTAGGELKQTISLEPAKIMIAERHFAYAPIVSPDGKLIAAASIPRGILIWDAGTGKLLTELKPPGENAVVREMRFGPKGDWLVSVGNGPGTNAGEAIIWRVERRAED